MNFPGGSVIKNPSAVQETSDPWVGKVPWRRSWQPTSVFLPGESHGQKSQWATVHEDATEWLSHTHTHTHTHTHNFLKTDAF